MKAHEAIRELEEIRLKVWRLRIKSKGSRWFCEILKAIESLLSGTKQSIEHIQRSVK